MSQPFIQNVLAREILDCRGNPTVEAVVRLTDAPACHPAPLPARGKP